MARLVFWELTIDLKSMIFNVFFCIVWYFFRFAIRSSYFCSFLVEKILFLAFYEDFIENQKKVFLKVKTLSSKNYGMMLNRDQNLTNTLFLAIGTKVKQRPRDEIFGKEFSCARFVGVFP